MAFKKSEYIWMNGQYVPWDDAKIHVLSHVIHYASSIFEGIRAYKTPKGTAIFRLPEHVRRLFDSAKIYHMTIPFTFDEILNAIKDTIRKNKLDACYIRPVVYRGYHSLGVDPTKCPVDVAIAVWEWGKYLGPEALEKGVNVKISTWTRMAPNTLPAMAKAAGNYMNSQLMKIEALMDGYEEGVALDVNGYISEGSGENIFVIRDDIIYTPPLGACILAGITRDSVIKIARSLGFEVREDMIPREFLYIADEAFFSGTAAEITPIATVDKIPIGEGKRGPITAKIQKMFFDIVEGRAEDKYNWLHFV